MVPAADVVEKVALPCPFLPDPQTVPSRETESWMEPSIELDLLRLLTVLPAQISYEGYDGFTNH